MNLLRPFVIVVLFVLFLCGQLTSVHSSPTPLNSTGIEWGKTYKKKDIPDLLSYKYYFGDVTWGTIVYLGQEDILGTESEIQLIFVNSGKIASALLILGPSGVTTENCMEKYNEVLSLMAKKYGPYKRRHIKEDPLRKDLVFGTICNSIYIGAYEIDTIWETPEFRIGVTIVSGEDRDFYVEIEYIRLGLVTQHKEERTQKILKRL